MKLLFLIYFYYLQFLSKIFPYSNVSKYNNITPVN